MDTCSKQGIDGPFCEYLYGHKLQNCSYIYSELARKNVLSQEMLGTITCERTLQLRALCISQSKTCVHKFDNRLTLKWTRGQYIKSKPVMTLKRVWINTVKQCQDWFGLVLSVHVRTVWTRRLPNPPSGLAIVKLSQP